MGKLLQINPVVRDSTSTGRIMRELGEFMMARGWKSYIAYSKGRDGVPRHSSQLIPVGSKADVAWHWLLTRLADRHGLCSKRATRKLIAQIEKIQPDIIQIHNIHGYFLNYPILFQYLAQCGKPVVWTTHDCWLYTGHCYHYDATGCSKWKTGCGHCPQKREFPASWLLDRSKRNYQDKKAAFNSVPELEIVNISRWMQEEMKQSFLAGARFHLIPNGIDLSIFHPRESASTAVSVVLCVASIWSREKGIYDILALSRQEDLKGRLVIVGQLEAPILRLFPSDVRHIPRTENALELARLYSAATVLVCPTYQDNYPTVIMEAVACGTPVVAYDTGGCPELVTPGTGYIVPQGACSALIQKTKEILQSGKDRYRDACLERARSAFDKNQRWNDYLKLYNTLLIHENTPTG